MIEEPSGTNIPLPHADGLVFRPPLIGDVDAWLGLVKRIAAFENAPWHAQRSELEAALADPGNPVAENALVGVDADGVLRAYAGVSKNPAGDKANVQGGVDPLWRRRGVGAALLAWQEAQAAARFAVDNALVLDNVQAPDPRVPKVRNHVEEDNVGQRALLAGAGYSVVRYYSQMQRPLLDLPAVQAPEGITITPLTDELSEAVRLAHNEAFADHWGSEPRTQERWAVEMRHEHLRQDLCTVAVDSTTGEVAGYQLVTVDPGDLRPGHGGEGYTELLGVRREWRGRGIAPALLADAMTRFVQAGLDRAALDVDTENPSGALRLYESMGYQPVRRSMVWDKLLGT